jgi:hypothetical protein
MILLAQGESVTDTANPLWMEHDQRLHRLIGFRHAMGQTPGACSDLAADS